MLFSNIVGHQALKQRLQQMVVAERIPHAQLFLGSSGAGSLALAIAFAQYMLCTDRIAYDACGQCAACRKASKLIHPDLHFSFPVIGSDTLSDFYLPQWRSALAASSYMEYNDWLLQIDAENKQGNINKKECVHIVKKMSFKPFEAHCKILILWLPEFLGKEGNRLLKLIEEPPPNTYFLLVAENQDLILNTILSRCQLVRVLPLSDAEIQVGLQKKGLSEAQAQRIAAMSEGRYSKALQLSTHQENENTSLFLDWLRKCYVGKPVPMVEWVETFAKIGREKQKFFFQYALHFMREYMYLKMTADTNQVRLLDIELATAQNLTKIIQFDQIEKLTNLFTDTAYHVERNANPRILFLDASIQIHHILRP